MSTSGLDALRVQWPHLPSRAQALERLSALSAPDKGHEDWRFISLKTLAAQQFALGSLPVASPPEEELEHLSFEGVAARLVFINGQLSQSLSSWPARDLGLEVVALDAAALDTICGAVLEEGFGQDYFTALNAAVVTQGLHIKVTPKNHNVQGALHVLHLGIGAQPQAMQLRHVIEVEAGSKLNLIEDYATLGEDSLHFTGACVEVRLAANAALNHVKLQREGAQSYHIARTAIKLVAGAQYQSVSVNMGAALSRHDLYADIHGADAHCALHGLTMITDRQVSDTHSTMNHSHAHATSDQLHKCVVGGKAHAVFNGKIFVREGAQQINAFQLNRNLLLSSTAKVDTKPQLEIFADDVKCSHGATIGQLDEEHLFYLQTRGINATQARDMLTYAFAGEVVERVPVLSVRRWLEQSIAHRANVR